MYSKKSASQGSVLLEALVGILIFSVGILALIAMQAESVRNTSEAKYRNDASYLANQIIGRMWADRNPQASGASDLSNYSHNPAGAVCSPTASASTYGTVQDWLADVNYTLPNAPPENQQIAIDVTTNIVTVTLCWQTGGSKHNLVVQTHIAG